MFWRVWHRLAWLAHRWHYRGSGIDVGLRRMEFDEWLEVNGRTWWRPCKCASCLAWHAKTGRWASEWGH